MFFALVAAHAQTVEFRGFWADAFAKGFKTPEQVSQLVADVRAAHCNAIVAEVRLRGDAYYNSKIEPRAADIADGFDPLADLIAKAHNTNSGPRIEVHAWLVTYPIWNRKGAQPPHPKHPYRLHPDWITSDSTGETWVGHNYHFDPGHPGVQQHIFDVCMDILSNYDVDGLQLDHIRYDDNVWGYNPVTVARFNTRFNRTGIPKPTDLKWLQFRRDQVSALVRKVYISSMALKPHVKISTACNTRAPGITNTMQWPRTAAFSSTLQDWRSWIEEGIVDIAMPMSYFDMSGKHAETWNRWSLFQKDHRYGRHIVIGPGPYLNSVSNSLAQIRSARQPSPSGNKLDGICFYSYAVTSKDRTPREVFLKALTQTNKFESNVKPVFSDIATTPAMPWKTSPVNGAVRGTIRDAATSKAIDGAVVVVSGPGRRNLTNDATGFYGAVELAPGKYSARVLFPGYSGGETNFVVAAGAVATCDVSLTPAKAR